MICLTTPRARLAFLVTWDTTSRYPGMSIRAYPGQVPSHQSACLLVNFPPPQRARTSSAPTRIVCPPPLHLRYSSQVSSPLFLLPPAPTTYRIPPFPSISNYPADPVPRPLLPLCTLQMRTYQVHTVTGAACLYPACSELLRPNHPRGCTPSQFPQGQK